MGEGVRVSHGYVGKHLAIDFDAGELETVNQLAVSDSVSAGGCVDFDVPELSHIALAFATVRECVGVGVKHGLVGLPEERVSPALVPFGHL